MQTPAVHEITELTVDQCLRLLATQVLGRLVYVVDDTPEIRPVNYTMHQGAVVFRTAYGGILEQVHRRPVMFEADHADRATHTGWSVIVRGMAQEIWRTTELEAVRGLGLRPWAPGPRDHYVRIVSTAISGRRVV